jgi:fido (protein-threonine AMPylation protein)
MFGDVWEWAGKPRLRDLSIGVPFGTVQESLYNLLKDFGVWQGMDSVEKAARLHHGAVHIHPFENGNGRWSRLIANISMRLDGETWLEWPEATIGTTSVIRAEYIEAIKAADRGDFKYLIDICRRYETIV